ncbi:MAG: hypothetical protein IJF47_01040 [Candidatus Methanomethylophilaceae archaeon]|nr:hypothetical protein [Candidatus Methanomethylophilaceae archaeon]
MTETQMTDEEFMQFVIENKEKIIELMKTVDSTSDNDLKDYVKNTERKVKDRAHQAKDKTEDFAKDMYSAVMNPDVHKHFIRMGMEFFMGLNELASRMPMPDSVKQFKEDVSTSTTEVRSEFCKNNKDCPAKAKSNLEKIELD